ncbi:MAG: membrane protein YdbS with pleckstrin-like domain [Polaribacter sp.]|jgi:membrane protein YdbS with pleckstrin-like domain
MFENEPVSDFPNITKIIFKSISKKFLKIILLNVSFLFCIILIGLILVDYFNLFEEFGDYFNLSYGTFIVVFSLVILLNFLAFKKRKYAIREKDISYKSGIFFKKLTTVPFSRVQHIEIDEKPISRLFGLASLSIYTAGDSSDDLVIKGVTKEIALQIKEYISTKINE